MDIYPELDHARRVIYVVEYMVDCFRYKRYSFDKTEIENFVNSKVHEFIEEGFEEIPIISKHANILFESKYDCTGEMMRKIKIKEIPCLKGNQPDHNEGNIYLYSVQTHIRGAGKFEAYSNSPDLLRKTKEETNARILKPHNDHIWKEKTPFSGRYICHASLMDKLSDRVTISYAYTKLEGRATDDETTPKYRTILSIVKLLEKY